MTQNVSRILFLFVIGASLSLGCARSDRSHIAACVLSASDHLEDLKQVETALTAAGIKYPGVECDLGVCEFCIQGESAERARQLVIKVIVDHSLSVRVSKDVNHPSVYDVYENGKRTREESYTVKQGP